MRMCGCIARLRGNSKLPEPLEFTLLPVVPAEHAQVVQEGPLGLLSWLLEGVLQPAGQPLP
jgi:hypothetical protein